MKHVIPIVILSLCIGIQVSAAPVIQFAGPPTGTFNVPSVVSDSVGESKLVQIACLEAKYNGGRALVAVDAAREILQNALIVFEDFGITIPVEKYFTSTTGLQRSIDTVCNAQSLVSAQSAVEDFKQEAQDLKQTLQEDVSADLKTDIEALMAEKQEEIEQQFKDEMQDYVDERLAEIESRLEAQAKAEAEKRKAQLQAEIQAEVEAEIKAQYGGQQNPDIDALLKLGEQMGRERGEARGKAVEAELEAKYRKLAEEETSKLEQDMEEYRVEKENEMRELYGDFDDIPGQIEELIEEKYEELYAQYKEQAVELRKEILQSVIAKHFENARELIEAKRDIIELADYNIKIQYGIPDTDSLLKHLDRDQRDLIATFAYKTDISESDIQAAAKEFMQKWEEWRERLEMVEFTAVKDIMEASASKINQSAITSKIQKKLNRITSIKAKYDGKISHCKQYPRLLVPASRNHVTACMECRSSAELQAISDITAQIQAEADIAVGLLQLLNANVNKAREGSLSVAEAVTYRDKLQSSFNTLNYLEKQYGKAIRAWESAAHKNQLVCLNYVK